jgi:hypothetical protein
MKPIRTPSTSEVMVSNMPPPCKEGPDRIFGAAGWNRVPSSNLVKQHRGYYVTVFQAPLGWTWSLSAPIPGSEIGQMGMKFATPNYRQVWSSV